MHVSIGKVKCKLTAPGLVTPPPHLDKDGNMSQQKFWKVTKKLLPKAQSVPRAVIDNLGNEITEPSNIKKLYWSEFAYRLRKRNMKAKLKEHESAVKDLRRVRLEIAQSNTTPDYQVEEVQNVMTELKLGKSVDPAGLIREVFIRGGSGLINPIIAMFNAFKKISDTPGQWDKMFITTSFKKKGCWKRLDYYRGIFIVMIL